MPPACYNTPELKLNDGGSQSNRFPQKTTYSALQERLDKGALKGTICLVGDFLSGKTVLIKRFLADRYAETTPSGYPLDAPVGRPYRDNPMWLPNYYLNVNLYLLEQLKKRGSLSAFALTKAKTRSMMQAILEEAIGEHFKRHDILVLDAIEIIYPYNLNLVSITDKFARDGKICIICVPEDKQRGFVFDFSWGMCEVIRLS